MERRRCLCSGCGSRFQVPASAVAKGPRCPKCDAALEVLPAAEPEAAPIELAPPPPPRRVPIVDRVSGRILDAEPPGAALPRKFAMTLDTVFFYPFSDIGGVIFLGFMVPVWAVLRAGVIPFSWVLRIFVGGYIAAYMFNVLFETSLGKNRAPGPPGLTGGGELFGYFARFFGATAVAYAPAIALWIYFIYSIVSGSGGDIEDAIASHKGLLVLLGAAVLFGTLYYPMALMVIGFAESWWAGFNYVFGIRSILRFPGDYLLCAVFFVVTMVAATLLEVFWVSASEEGAFAGLALALVMATVVEFYLWVVQMRALGLLYVTNKERLGWFR